MCRVPELKSAEDDRERHPPQALSTSHVIYFNDNAGFEWTETVELTRCRGGR